jgi:hypothetical protein
MRSLLAGAPRHRPSLNPPKTSHTPDKIALRPHLKNNCH